MSILTTAQTFLKAKGPFITTGLALVTGVATVVMAVKATPKYHLAVDNATAEKGDELSKVEKTKIFVKHYAPAAAMGAVTGGLMVSTLILSERKAEDAIGGIAAAYALSETKVKDLIKAQKEELTKKEQDAIKSNVADQVLRRSPVSEQAFAAAAGTSSMVVKDTMTNNESVKTMSDILEAQIWLNAEMAKDNRKNDVTLNQLLEHLDMEICDVGDDYVFSYRFDDEPVEIEVTGRYDEVHERLVGVLDYNPRPTNTCGYY